MPDLVAVALPAGPAFVVALQRIWDRGDAALPVDARLPPPARRPLLDAMAPASLLDVDGEQPMDKATFDKIDEIISNVQAKAPAEIKDDVATVAKNFQDVRAIFAQYDFDIAKLTSAATADSSLTDKLQSLNSDEFNAASQRVNTYLQEKCGIQAGS